jgi:3-deoxy-D-manno-octulosonate 8-phosphate phosphatase (KDO 8-P phosphatase)
MDTRANDQEAANTARARSIKWILMDVDGTLTDGLLTVMPDGEELKAYHVRDGMGILMAHLVGLRTGIITGKTSEALTHRAKRLRVSEVHQGILDKNRVYEDLLRKYGLQDRDVAFIGDDLGDLPVLKRVGLAAAVADAHPRVKEHCHYICSLAGGRGAVREFLEFIFAAQDRWPAIEARLNDLKGSRRNRSPE